MLQRVEFGGSRPPESVRLAWCDWCRWHGIDPSDVPLNSWIERDEKRRQITYEAYARNAKGNIYLDETRRDAVREVRVVQLEAVPSPFPC